MIIKHRILLINPFSSAQYISSEFKKYDIHTTALYTVDLSQTPIHLLPARDTFDEQIFFLSSTVEDIVKYLGSKKFDYVINGSEGSVQLSDKLACHYTPSFANNPESSALRSDKFEMHQILARNNLGHIHQLLYTRDNNLPKLSDFGLNYPCFIKPLTAASSVGACKINNQDELEKYFAASYNVKNMFATEYSYDKFLIADFIEGDELFVDTFSIRGKHYISSIHQYHKNYYKSIPLCCFEEIIKDKQRINKISNYIRQVLDITKFNNGFAHTEMFITKDGEIKLIEINPRISGAGGIPNKLAKLYGLPTQIDLLVQHIFNIEPKTTQTSMTARALLLFNFGGNPLYDLRTHLKHWESVHEVNQLVPDGFIQSNDDVNLTNTAAFIILQSPSTKIIEQHTQEILAQDKLGWTHF